MAPQTIENGQLDAALCRLAASAREWTAVIDATAAPLARFPIDCPDLARRPAAVRKRAVALALDRAGIDFTTRHLEAIDRLVRAPVAGQVVLDLPGVQLARTYATLAPVGPPPRSPASVAPPDHAYRGWRPGDRMKPARLRGRSRKLSDLFADAKVPRDHRVAALVLVRTRDDTIVWAEHIGPAFDASPDLVPL